MSDAKENAPGTTKRRRRFSPLLILATIFGVLVLATGGLALYIVTWDVPPPNDSDLQPAWRPVPPERNGYAILRGVTLTAEVDREFELRGVFDAEEWNAEIARKAVEANTEALATFGRALAAPEFQLEQKHLQTDLNHIHTWYRICELAGALARIQLDAGDVDAAVENVGMIVRLGHRLENGGGLLVAYHAGINLRSKGLTYFRSIVSQSTPLAEQTRGILELLDSVRIDVDGLANALKAEYSSMSEIVDDAEQLTADDWMYGLDFLVSPNHTRTILADSYRQIIANARRQRLERTPVSPPPIVETVDVFGVPIPVSLTNIGGRSIAAWSVPSIALVLDSLDFARFHLESTRAFVALRAHELEHGELPETLDELVPAWLPEVPRDPYDGKPLRYSKEKRRIWAVGDDLVDVGGVEAGFQSLAGEPTVQLEFEPRG